jgi:hypothetical protein
MNDRICKKCNLQKDISLFVKKKKKDGTIFYLYNCLECTKKYNKQYRKQYYQDNKKILINDSKEWYQSNLDKKKAYDKIRGSKNKNNKKEYDKNYREINKDKISKRISTYRKLRRSKDPQYKLRKSISFSIWYYLNLNGSSKGNNSIMKYLPYSIKELKQYLELLFEPWMTWNNYGMYHVQSWKDEDQLTWTWNIDHVIPQSKLPYTSMEDENFKNCWSLKNLRPLSSKQNLLKSNMYEEEVK